MRLHHLIHWSAVSATEYLPICDEGNRCVGRAARAVVHAQGLLHRAVHILVFNRMGELFLQRRGADKDTFPGWWDTSVGGHVDLGETPKETALRELREELALEGEPCLVGEIAPMGKTGWEFVTVYELTTDQTPHWDGVEVVDGRWVSPGDVETLLAHGELSLTPSFRETFALWAGRQAALPKEREKTA
jgi:isopentenyl-diphosphate Delta-isomerase